MMLLSMTSCAPLPAAPDSVCVSMRPIYLSEPAIRAMAPFRADREQIAAHNKTWEAICPS